MPFSFLLAKSSPRALLLLALLFFLAALFLYSRHAAFPSYYHADEPSKVDQLVREYRNFKHPPLMLNIAEGAATLLHTPRDREDLARLGRFLSAFYAAGTVALLAAIAAGLRSISTGFLTGLLCLFCPPLYEAAHYFKEDTLFLFLAALNLGLIIAYSRRPLHRPPGFWPVALGLAAGLLVSSRYFTLIFLPFIFFGLGWHRQKRSALLFIAALVFTLLLIHLPSLRWLPGLLQEFPLETHYMLAGHYDVGLPVPHFEYFKYWTGATSPILWFFLAVFFFFLFSKPQPAVWIALALLLAYWIILSFLPKYSERYFLPVLLGTLFFAAWGADYFTRLGLHFRARRSAPVMMATWLAATALLLYSSGAGFAKMEDAFAHDSRSELASWIRENLPPRSKIAQDDLVRVESLRDAGFTVLSSEFAPDLGPPSELRRQGVNYVIVCRRSFYNYTEPGLAAGGSKSAEFLRRNHFYLEVLQRGKILWQAPDRDPKILHPGLILIDIRGIN